MRSRRPPFRRAGFNKLAVKLVSLRGLASEPADILRFFVLLGHVILSFPISSAALVAKKVFQDGKRPRCAQVETCRFFPIPAFARLKRNCINN